MQQTLNRRERLILAATDLFLSKGLGVTTLANISESSQVPLGNVYYYFKSKTKITEAVIETQHDLLTENLLLFSKEEGPKARLAKLVSHFLDTPQDTQGQPAILLRLWNDISVDKGEIFYRLKETSQSIIQWSTNQFEQLGRGHESKLYARQLFAYLQGMLLYKKSNSLQDFQKQLIATSLGFA